MFSFRARNGIINPDYNGKYMILQKNCENDASVREKSSSHLRHVRNFSGFSHYSKLRKLATFFY